MSYTKFGYKKCAICKAGIEEWGGEKGNTSCIDHDHKTNKVRGLLCSKCNLGIGMFEDNSENLKNAIEYLKGVEK